ncbi:alpha/beta hydrolase fold domain-containing protein [Photorhabdus laumondii subsp. laumondii]|uniref:Photorhabdus luminescens subsp. laumondii TTO1 complete genome segment 8/17 n=2 Tax=Photorhabdus laumondii subsp. laumondii TaxID=141679 RepID=Q7N4Q6_PHOLL|nr:MULTISPECIES: alpha/beta hydrolase [Photorhabdus]AWK42039.1 esterase [Photorhabdus laumondii subsp. laumondii]AXG47362.1 alpha/beta hydrolase [Photorhabdus laumondii subsp. laumondii]MCC8385910.1 alpha/beta hydrolase [Photorhabdus laumondii]MCC8414063.1 alpha/beta hydrolase [Photorhabdus laumondii]NDK96628.1 alpha/beta hydrolase fold domain-containing protein [Photorhabdus laumondii subsp. laumondii]
MPLDKNVEKWLASTPEIAIGEDSPLEQLRIVLEHALIQQQGEWNDATYNSSFTVLAEDGFPIPVRMYVPYGKEKMSDKPALVYAHGGGWCLGSLDAWDRPCRKLAESMGCVIFSVDYRLAPENPFPVPLTDFYAALCYVTDNAEKFGINRQQIAVGGDSAGGNLAVAACLMSRNQEGPAICYQLLFYPALDASMETDSYDKYGEGYVLTKQMMAFFWQAYINEHNSRTNPLISPSHLTHFEGLPDATILLCEYDPLRSEGEAYAQQLRDAGVSVQIETIEGMIHGAMHMTAVTPSVEAFYKKFCFC